MPLAFRTLIVPALLKPLCAGNDFNEATCCLLAPSLANTVNLIEIELDKEPFACIRSGDWKKTGLAHLPEHVAHLDWVGVIQHLSRSSKVADVF